MAQDQQIYSEPSLKKIFWIGMGFGSADRRALRKVVSPACDEAATALEGSIRHEILPSHTLWDAQMAPL